MAFATQKRNLSSCRFVHAWFLISVVSLCFGLCCWALLDNNKQPLVEIHAKVETSDDVLSNLPPVHNGRALTKRHATKNGNDLAHKAKHSIRGKCASLLHRFLQKRRFPMSPALPYSALKFPAIFSKHALITSTEVVGTSTDGTTSLSDVPQLAVTKLSSLDVGSSDQIHSFEEWKALHAADKLAFTADPVVENLNEMLPESSANAHSSPAAGITNNKLPQQNGASGGLYRKSSKFNYASQKCGARIRNRNAEAHNADAVLNSNRDDYMVSQCDAKKFFTVELCQPVQPQAFEIGSLEFFSSPPRLVRLRGSQYYPGTEWIDMGTYTLRDERLIQHFNFITPPPAAAVAASYYVKFIRVDIEDVYRGEYFCPLSMFRLYGLSFSDEYSVHDQPGAADPLATATGAELGLDADEIDEDEMEHMRAVGKTGKKGAGSDASGQEAGGHKRGGTGSIANGKVFVENVKDAVISFVKQAADVVMHKAPPVTVPAAVEKQKIVGKIISVVEPTKANVILEPEKPKPCADDQHEFPVYDEQADGRNSDNLSLADSSCEQHFQDAGHARYFPFSTERFFHVARGQCSAPPCLFCRNACKIKSIPGISTGVKQLPSAATQLIPAKIIGKEIMYENHLPSLVHISSTVAQHVTDIHPVHPQLMQSKLTQRSVSSVSFVSDDAADSVHNVPKEDDFVAINAVVQPIVTKEVISSFASNSELITSALTVSAATSLYHDRQQQADDNSADIITTSFLNTAVATSLSSPASVILDTYETKRPDFVEQNNNKHEISMRNDADENVGVIADGKKARVQGDMMHNSAAMQLLSSNSLPLVKPPPIQQQQQAEPSILMLISNRVRALELNVSLTSAYLEELSRRYKKQSEELLKKHDASREQLRVNVEKFQDQEQSVQRLQNSIYQVEDSVMQITQLLQPFHARNISLQHIVLIFIGLCLVTLLLAVVLVQGARVHCSTQVGQLQAQLMQLRQQLVELQAQQAYITAANACVHGVNSENHKLLLNSAASYAGGELGRLDKSMPFRRENGSRDLDTPNMIFGYESSEQYTESVVEREAVSGEGVRDVLDTNCDTEEQRPTGVQLAENNNTQQRQGVYGGIAYKGPIACVAAGSL